VGADYLNAAWGGVLASNPSFLEREEAARKFPRRFGPIAPKKWFFSSCSFLQLLASHVTE
jgi:hypothetical protein